jgi:hypothetical protein
MKLPLFACAAVACALLASGCSSGEGGTADPTFNPFGTDPVLVTGSEPTISGDDMMMPGGQQSIEQACAAACTRLARDCPSAQGSNCVSSCVSSGFETPNCMDEFRAAVLCIATAPLTCNGASIDAPACDAAAIAYASCAGLVSR